MEQRNGIIEQITNKLPSMTASQAKIANAILTDPTLCLFASIEQVSAQLEISTATIVRFAKTLGMHGYSQLQEALREYYRQHFEPVVRLNSPDNEMSLPTDESPFSRVYRRQMHLLESLYTSELEEKLNQAQDLLFSAGHIYTVGARGSFACAYYLGHHFNRILTNCDILEDNARLSDGLLRLKPDDVLFVVNQPRYSKQLFRTTLVAKEMQAKIIVISDTVLSPYQKLADVFFAVPTQSGDFHNSLMASMMIAEMLITSIVTSNKARSRNSLQKMEHIVKELDIFM